MEIKVVRELPEDRWRDFVERHPQGNVFHTPEVHRVFGKAEGYEAQLWAATDGQGTPICLFLPVTISLRRGLGRIFFTRTVVYGGVLAAQDGWGERALDELLGVYERQRRPDALFTEIRNLDDTRRIQPVLRKHGFAYEEHLNYLIDLAGGPEEVLESIGPRTRKKIRQSMRSGLLDVREVASSEELPGWYAVLEQSYLHARVPAPPRSLFEAALGDLRPLGMVRCTSALGAPEKVVASSIELLYKGVVFGWYGGVDRSFAKLNPSEVITWDVLRWGAAGTYRVYDFGGAGKPGDEYGVRDFKAKFGGRLVNFGRNTCVHRPLLTKVCEFVYDRVRMAMPSVTRTIHHVDE